jgi:predicted nucleic acid-binding protein
MTTNRIGFRQFRNKFTDAQEINIVIDSNILVAYYDEIHTSHEIVRNFLREIDAIAQINFYTTVTTKAEFLDYQRRRFLSEGLFDLVDEYNTKIPVSMSVRFAINAVKARRNDRQKREDQKSNKNPDHEFDSRVAYLTDSEIKEVKKAFRARDIDNETGWLKICETFLRSRLIEQESFIDEFCQYLSPHREEQKELFIDRHVNWKKATAISTTSGMSYSDSLILNMLLHTKIDYILTLDYDMIYASAVSAQNKWVVLPDDRIKDFKATLKGVQ